MLGLSEKVFLSHTQNNVRGLLYPVLIAIPIVLLARFVVVYALVPLINAIPGAKPIDHRYRAALAWGGLRGAVAIALAMSLPKHFPYRWQIIDLAFGVTLFTLLVNGSTMSWLMRRLGLEKPSLLEDFMATVATAEAKRRALQCIDNHRPVGEVDKDVLQKARARYSSELQQAEAHLSEIRMQLRENRKKRHKLLWLQAFAIQRETYQQRYQAGLLSQDAHRTLEWNLKRKYIGVDRRSGPVVENQSLPSEQNRWFSLMGLIAQIFPGTESVRRWQARYATNLHEEAAALVAASRAVQAGIADIAKRSDAEQADVERCKDYYLQLERMAVARLKLIEQGSQAIGSDALNIEERMLDRVALQSQKDTLHHFALVGELPENVAERLQQTLDADYEASR
jgi:CPA1 family monovalent cation:H+ antiporter